MHFLSYKILFILTATAAQTICIIWPFYNQFMQHIGLYFMAGMYIIAGILHFVSPRTYMAIMPPYIPYPRLMVDISGLFEIALGVGLLFPQTRSLAAWGLILLLIAVFPANLYMATSGKFQNIPQWLLWVRLPLQGVLIWWASRYI